MSFKDGWLSLSKASRPPVPTFLRYILLGLFYNLAFTSVQTTALSQQNSPQAVSDSDITTAGLKVNNQTNLQINPTSFYGFGPGINCPTSTLTLGVYADRGEVISYYPSVRSATSPINVGAILLVRTPLGVTNSKICTQLGREKVKSLQALTSRILGETSKSRAVLNNSKATACITIQKVAYLYGKYSELCKEIGLDRRPSISQYHTTRELPDMVTYQFEPDTF
jgi:hypothetical protein